MSVKPVTGPNSAAGKTAPKGKQHATIQARNPLAGSNVPIPISGGTSPHALTPKRASPPAPSGSPAPRNNSPTPPLTRPGSYTASTASSRSKSSREETVTRAAAPMLHRAPSKKGGSARQLPGTTEPKPIVRKSSNNGAGADLIPPPIQKSAGPTVALPWHTDTITTETLQTLLGGNSGSIPSADAIRQLNVTSEDCGRMKCLNLSNTDISDEQLRALLDLFLNLETVEFSNCTHLTDAGMAALDRLAYLEEFHLIKCPRVTHAGFAALPLERLEVFRAETDNAIGVPVFRRLASGASIRRVELTHYSKLSNEELSFFATAHQLFPIQIFLTRSRQINTAVVNKNRNVQPIQFKYSSEDEEALPAVPPPAPAPKPQRSAVDFLIATTPGPLSPRRSNDALSPRTPHHVPSVENLWDDTDVEQSLRELEKGQARDPEETKRAPRKNREKEEFKSEEPARGLPPIDFSAFSNGRYGTRVSEMMAAAVNGTEPSAEILFMDEPDLLETVPKPEPARTVQSDSLTLHILNALFTKKEDSRVPKRRFSIGDDIEDSISLGAVLPTPEEISKLEMTEEECRKVTCLSLFQATITDEQLVAIVDRFPFLERVELNMCPELSDAGMASLGRLKYLKEFDYSHCPKVTNRSLAALPLETLHVFGALTDGEIGVPIFTRLARSPHLRKVVLTMCPSVTPEELGCLAQAHTNFPIVVRLTSCDRIKPANVEAINGERVEQPLKITFAVGDEDSLSGIALPTPVVMPPAIPVADDILSAATMATYFDKHTLRNLKEGRILPEASVIEALGIIANPLALPPAAGIPAPAPEEPVVELQLRGVELNGKFSNSSLEGLINRFPGMSIVSITNNPELSLLAVLRQLENVRTLYLGKLSGITQKMVETMFSYSAGEKKTWQHLTEVHLTEIPVSDASLQFLSLLPHLKKVTLASCHAFTVQGLKNLMRGCPALEELSLIECSGIDPLAVEEFRVQRGDIIEAEFFYDSTIAGLAMQEADGQLWLNQALTNFIFQPGLEKQAKPDVKAINQFYADKLALIGVVVKVDPAVPPLNHWKRCDRILQEYINIFRTAKAIQKELTRVGFFLPNDLQQAPRTVQGLIQYTTQQSIHPVTGQMDYVFRRKVQIMDFEDLGIDRIPKYLYDSKAPWSQLQPHQIRLRGNLFEEAPEELVELCTGVAAPPPKPLPEKKKGIMSSLFGWMSRKKTT